MKKTKEKKTETFIYKGLGFPIELIDVPMKKVFGEWVIDIDMNELQLVVLKGLIHKPHCLTGKELRFMRKYLDLSMEEFGKRLGVSLEEVASWEEGKKIIPPQEIYIRMFFMGCLQDKEVHQIYDEIKPDKLAMSKKNIPLPINAKTMKIAI